MSQMTHNLYKALVWGPVLFTVSRVVVKVGNTLGIWGVRKENSTLRFES